MSNTDDTKQLGLVRQSAVLAKLAASPLHGGHSGTSGYTSPLSLASSAIASMRKANKKSRQPASGVNVDLPKAPKMLGPSSAPPNMSRRGPNKTLILDRKRVAPNSPMSQPKAVVKPKSLPKMEKKAAPAKLPNAATRAVGLPSAATRASSGSPSPKKGMGGFWSSGRMHRMARDMMSGAANASIKPGPMKSMPPTPRPQKPPMSDAMVRATQRSGGGPQMSMIPPNRYRQIQAVEARKRERALKEPITMKKGKGYNWLAKQMGGNMTGAQLRKQMGGRMLVAGKKYNRLSAEQIAAASKSKGMASRWSRKPAQQMAASGPTRTPMGTVKPIARGPVTTLKRSPLQFGGAKKSPTPVRMAMNARTGASRIGQPMQRPAPRVIRVAASPSNTARMAPKN